MAELGCFLGLRISEILGLQWQDIDWEAGTLRVCRSAVDGHVGETKTEASQDSIPLSAEMLALLQGWQSEAPLNAEGWLFANPISGKPYHAGILLRRHLHPVAKTLKMPRFGWHTFRHTFRSWLDAVGTPVGVQQRMMRHADISTTMNFYGGALLESKREAQNKLLRFAGVGLCGVETEEQLVSA